MTSLLPEQHAATAPDMVFLVPLPPRLCSPNAKARFNVFEVSKAKAGYKQEVWVHARNADHRWKRPDRARVSLLFGTARTKGPYKPALYRPQDIGNAVSAFKAGFDGLVEAGFLVDDDAKHMALGSVEIDSTVGPWVRVTIEVLEAER